MKKFLRFAFILAALTTSFVFTSCGDDDDDLGPSLAVTQVNNADGNYSFKVEGRAGDSNLATLVIRNAGRSAEDMSSNVWSGVADGNGVKGKISGSTFNQTITFSKDLTDKKFEFVLTDRNDLATTVTVTATDGGGEVDDNLSSAASFNLGRPAQTDYPNVNKGLTYSQNLNTTTAEFTGDIVLLANKAAYDAITTKTALKAAYTAGAKVNKFTAESNANFKPVYLIVKEGETYRLVEMKSLTFAEGANKATFTEKN